MSSPTAPVKSKDTLAGDALALTQTLLRTPSVTPHSGAAVEVVAKALEAAGYKVERLTFDTGGPAIANLYARIGEAGPNLCFAGHVDVVPPGDAAHWRHGPFSGEVVDGQLYGRGAVDMKGGVGAALAAALTHGRPAQGCLSFLITGDEEGPALDGTIKVVEWLKARGERIDHCVLGEPTNPQALGDAVKIGRRGSLSGVITVTGRQGHAAYPHLADNPIPKLVRLVGALLATPLDAGTAHFQPSNLEVVSIDVGNPAFNVIPAEATARFNVRFNDTYSLASLEAELRRRLAEVGEGIAYSLEIRAGGSESFLTAPGPFVELVSSAIAEVTGRTPELSTSGGTSDARFIKDICPVVEFGLVGKTMHAVDEVTPVADLAALAEIYARIIDRYFATLA
ncbi:succinyl-diaminopimelate desuccinylase [Aquabacter sp. L1I39]|uniref:succinyl-diaminopimelate desuccinylase n=1 Tax=Aquabacter sp. L1I39 TaxID=2820278 RepID=UPI001ADC3C3D|nr:succinyl-diaminopimelate desuccinylase [Aquabacter sp. L1I39]QTL02782.1 succinyl-diaminopimelate desuccinylase [Aquabacter sp. L1I39]